jgi:tight adherence protein B
VSATMTYWLAFLMVFAMVFFVSMSLVAVAGGGAQRRLRVRLAVLRDEGDEGEKPLSLIREKYLRQLSPLERMLEELPGMRPLARLIEQAGRNTPAYVVVLTSAALSLSAGLAAAALSGRLWPALFAALVALPVPLLRIVHARGTRIGAFEEQLPDALDMMGRALRAGMPLTESFKFVGEEMRPPIADEFRTTWSHINYGISMKASFQDLCERMPCVSLRAMTTAVLVQRETGGNLSEIFDKIAAVLRGRFRFERRLRTLTAEGRLSAWVLVLMPFVLSGVLAISSPDYLPMLADDPFGQKLIAAALCLIVAGCFWIRAAIRVRV